MIVIHIPAISCGRIGGERDDEILTQSSIYELHLTPPSSTGLIGNEITFCRLHQGIVVDIVII